VKEMAKFLGVWRLNPNAPWPTDPVEMTKVAEMLFAAADNSFKEGKMLEFGFFPDGTSGYAITSGDAKDEFRHTFSSFPWVVGEVHEIVPYETGKEVMRAVMKAQAEAMAAMKR
jgi:hypothetical protein